ncbi:MAG: hypothetical protein K6G64_05000 [Eubacterium sp.]|nr:hypothetical protein [Eubacterium sp.]
MKKFNKTIMKTIGVVAIVAAVGFIGTTNSVEAKTLKINKKYSINLDGKKGKETIEIKSKKIKNSVYDKFTLYIDGKKVLKVKGYDACCKVLDINKKKAGKEIAFYGRGNSCTFTNKAGIFTYKKGKLNKVLDLGGDDKEMSFGRVWAGSADYITTDGKGTLTIGYDSPSGIGMASYIADVKFEYKKGKLVRKTKNEVVFNKKSREYQYELNEDATVYQKPSQTSGVKATLKKNTKLSILKVRYDVIKDKVTVYNHYEACYNIYAFVKAADGTEGWIALKKYPGVNDKNNQFKAYQEWA